MKHERMYRMRIIAQVGGIWRELIQSLDLQNRENGMKSQESYEDYVRMIILKLDAPIMKTQSITKMIARAALGDS